MAAENFSCEDCGKTFTRLSNLHRHHRSAHRSNSFRCQTCGRCFNRRDNYLRHTRNHPENSDKESYASVKVTNSKNSDNGDKENMCPNQSGSGKSSNDIKGKVFFFSFVLYICIILNVFKFHIRHVFISLQTMKLKRSKKIVFQKKRL